MKYSLRIKLALTLIILVAGSIWANWMINSIFQEKYYIANKEKELCDVYSLISDENINFSDMSIQKRIELVSTCENKNINVLVLDASFYPVFSSGYNVMDNGLLDRVKYIIFQQGMEAENSIKSTENYFIQKTVDSNNNTDYLEMFGTLYSGELFIMRTSLESIKQIVKVSNQFFAYVGGVTIIVSVFIVLVFSMRITGRIGKLAHISDEMSKLNFNIKYFDKGHDEITVLGNNMNILSEKLESTISELKTANNELQKDIEKKTRIDEMRKEFLSNVSHELKTPLAIIQGYAEGLKESVNDDEESRNFYCDVIMDEAGKMNKMVKKLLTLNQIEFGNNQVEMERIDIIAVIDQVLNRFSVMIQEKGARIFFDNSKKIFVWADEFQTEEVITNYVSNALNHLDYEKDINISIEETDNSIRVKVYNTGNHIPDEDIDRIWDKFYKVDKARTREYGGNGIGLSIVKAIMESMNRQYGVSNVQGGVEFWFDLEKSQ